MLSSATAIALELRQRWASSTPTTGDGIRRRPFWLLASAAAVSPVVEVGLAAVGGAVSPLGGASVAMTARQASYTPRAAQLASVAGAGRVQLSD